VVVNASLRSYIIRHDQSGLSRPNTRGKGIITIYNMKAINKFKALWKAINVFKANMESNK
jgi:hypothetical protein